MKPATNACICMVMFNPYNTMKLPCVNIAEPSDLLKTFNSHFMARKHCSSLTFCILTCALNFASNYLTEIDVLPHSS